MTSAKLKLRNRVKGLQNSYGESDIGFINNGISAADDNNRPIVEHYVATHDDSKVQALKNQIDELNTISEREKEESFKLGYSEGEGAAQIESEKKIMEISESFKSVVKSLEEKYEDAILKMDQPLLKLATKIAEKIINRELRINHEYGNFLIRQIRNLLAEAADQSRLTIHVHPSLLEWISNEENTKELNIPGTHSVNFVGNHKLKPGECLLETEDFIMEGVLSRQLSDIENQILDKEIE